MRKLDWVSPLPPGLPFTHTVAEAAEWLRVSKGSVYELVHRGIATDGAEGLPVVQLGLDRTWRIPTIAVLRLVGVLEPTPQPNGPAPELRSLPPVVTMELLEPRSEDHSRLPKSQLVLDGRILGSVASSRPMAWVVLEAVALGAHLVDEVLVAHTSARQLAERLGRDPGTAAAVLRLLRKRGLLELRRSVGEAGRFGLSPTSSATSPPLDFARVQLRPARLHRTRRIHTRSRKAVSRRSRRRRLESTNGGRARRIDRLSKGPSTSWSGS